MYFYSNLDCSNYPDYVFQTFDQNKDGIISFKVNFPPFVYSFLVFFLFFIMFVFLNENFILYSFSYVKEFVFGLAILSRGSIEGKLKWIFSLYDVDGDGRLTFDDMLKVVSSVYNIIGSHAKPSYDEHVIKEHASEIFQVKKREKCFHDSCTDKNVQKHFSSLLLCRSLTKRCLVKF